MCVISGYLTNKKMFGMGGKLRIKGYLDGIISIIKKGYIILKMVYQRNKILR